MNSFRIYTHYWDVPSQTLRFQIGFDNPFILRVIVIAIKVDRMDDETLFYQTNKLKRALDEYPKDQIDSKLSDVHWLLKTHFGKHQAAMIRNRNTTLAAQHALYLKGRQETKKVSHHKISTYEKKS